ncbi:glycosyltransferase family 2 protein [bacterium CPR1]|nr:glycosyltransferase family 2 protein [bacterium CPR1]
MGKGTCATGKKAIAMGFLVTVIPAFNQARELAILLPLLCGPVLVVDDGSSDQTARVASRHGAVPLRLARSGYGAALIAGFAWAMQLGFERVVTMDADLQHDPEDLPALLAGSADIVSGSRFLPQSRQRGLPPPPERQKVNRTVCQRLSELTGWRLSDAFCGLKAYRARALERLQLDEPGYAMPLQLWVQAWRAGLSLQEVPVTCIYHSAGPGRPLHDYLAVLEREACSTCSR